MRADRDSIEFTEWLRYIGNNKIKTLNIPHDLLCNDFIGELYLMGKYLE